jgi:hypothetical protein
MRNSRGAAKKKRMGVFLRLGSRAGIRAVAWWISRQSRRYDRGGRTRKTAAGCSWSR